VPTSKFNKASSELTTSQPQLSHILQVANTPNHIVQEVLSICEDLQHQVDALPLSTVDILQLREYAVLSARINKIELAAEEYFSAGDLRNWSLLITKAQGDATAKRAILKDLRATRFAKTPPPKHQILEIDPDAWNGLI
jgi:hypothetical protein